jgi:hypothetical protein
MTTTHILETGEADIDYDVRGPLPTAEGRPPLLMIGQPMTAGRFGALASHFPDRTVVTYDRRALGRSVRKDGRVDNSGLVEAARLRAEESAITFISCAAATPHWTRRVASANAKPARDGSRDNPLLSDRSLAITSYRPDVDALVAAPTRVVIAIGEESHAARGARRRLNPAA